MLDVVATFEAHVTESVRAVFAKEIINLHEVKSLTS